jgi:ADP-ribose pyrophosphatase YjhB (NUDIX family)
MTKYNIGAFVVIFNKKGRVLLCHRRDMDIWNLPGGGVENGELPDEAAIRETREETGIKVKIKDLVGVYGKQYRDEIVFVFRGKVVGGKVKATSESDKTRYFKTNKLPINTIPKHVERIRDAEKNKTKPYFRRQYSLSARKWLEKIEQKQFLQKYY